MSAISPGLQSNVQINPAFPCHGGFNGGAGVAFRVRTSGEAEGIATVASPAVGVCLGAAFTRGGNRYVPVCLLGPVIMGTVRLHPDGVSLPRGGDAVYWDGPTQRWARAINASELAGAQGVALAPAAAAADQIPIAVLAGALIQGAVPAAGGAWIPADAPQVTHSGAYGAGAVGGVVNESGPGLNWTGLEPNRDYVIVGRTVSRAGSDPNLMFTSVMWGSGFTTDAGGNGHVDAACIFTRVGAGAPVNDAIQITLDAIATLK